MDTAAYASDRAMVDARLRALLARGGVPIPVRRFVLAGKQLRARCLFASALRDSSPYDSHLVSASAGIELLQAASLLHDDIVDRCVSRRGTATVAAVAGTRAASVTGGYLMHLALEIISELPRRARNAFARAARDVCRGQMTELMRTGDVMLTPDGRTTIMEQKTASVFQLACELGALLTGGSRDVIGAARSFGRSFGILFQIADDVDDLYGTERELGRPPGADLRQGVVSLPLAFALSDNRSGVLAATVEGMSDGGFPERLARCRHHVRESGALRRSYEVAHEWACAALAALESLPSARGVRWMTDVTSVTVARIERWL